MVGKPFQVLASLTKLLLPFGRRSTNLDRVVANTIEIETLTECTLLRLSQYHFHDAQASKVFRDMALVSGRLASVLTGNWGRLKMHSDTHTAIKIEGVVQMQQKALLNCLKAIFQYINTRPLVLRDAIALCFQIGDRQKQLAEEMMKSEGIQRALTADSDPILFFKSPISKAGLFALAQREGLEFGQQTNIPELLWTQEMPASLVAASRRQFASS